MKDGDTRLLEQFLDLAREGRLEEMKQMLAPRRVLFFERPPLLTLTDDLKASAFELAIDWNQLAVARFLIAEGADVRAPVDQYASLLWKVFEKGRREAAELLIEHGADLDEPQDGQTLLIRAVERNERKDVEWLLAAGASLDSCNAYGKTALDLCLERNDLEMAKQLVQAGADVQQGFRDALGKREYEGGGTERLEALIQLGANPLDNGDGTTPLRAAGFSIYRGTGEEAIGFLIARGARVDPPADDEESILHKSASHGSAELTDLLLSNGARVEWTDEHDRTALHVATLRRRIDQVEALLRAGSDVNARRRRGQTPLHDATGSGEAELVDLLRAHGADADLADEAGETPSMLLERQERYAAMSTEDLVKELIGIAKSGYEWAIENQFPLVEDYPGYQHVRLIGRTIHGRSGFEGMKEVCEILRGSFTCRDGTGGQFIAEWGWRGIGGWMP